MGVDVKCGKIHCLEDSNITVRNTVEFGLEKCKGFIWGK